MIVNLMCYQPLLKLLQCCLLRLRCVATSEIISKTPANLLRESCLQRLRVLGVLPLQELRGVQGCLQRRHLLDVLQVLILQSIDLLSRTKSLLLQGLHFLCVLLSLLERLALATSQLGFQILNLFSMLELAIQDLSFQILNLLSVVLLQLKGVVSMLLSLLVELGLQFLDLLC